MQTTEPLIARIAELEATLRRTRDERDHWQRRFEALRDVACAGESPPNTTAERAAAVRRLHEGHP